MSPQAPSPIRLVPIVCVKCKAPIPAQADEIAWVCDQCGQGLLLDATPAPGPDESATRALTVFYSDTIKPGQKGHPFWVVRGKVTISTRQTYKGDEGRASHEFWAVPRLFYIPAWETSLDEIISMGVDLLQNPQRMVPGSRMPFLPVVTSPNDIRALAEFIVMSVEADRRDALKTVGFDMTLELPQLWILD